MKNDIGVCESVTCNKCQLESKKCSCLIPDFTQTIHKPTFNVYKSLYEEIAQADLKESLQSQAFLSQKAQEDFERIVKFKKKYFSDVEDHDFRVLEIGTGLGHLGILIEGKNYKYFATDIVEDYLLTSSKSSFVANVEHLPKFEIEFNLIIACDVFEHVLNEGDAILSVYDSLANNGGLYIRSPYLETSVNYATNLGARYPFIHLRTYTRKLLRNLVNSTGLEIKELQLGSVVMMSHTRRNYLFRKSNFEKLRIDLSNAYGSKRYHGNSKSKVESISWLEKRYRIYENKALNSIDKTDLLSRTLRWVFFRPVEIWCFAVKRE